MTLILPFCAIIGELSFRHHRNRSPRAFSGANPASLAEIQVRGIKITPVFQALRRAVEGTKTAVIALLFIEHRPGDPPTPRIQTKQPFTTIGPRAFTGKNELMFDYHRYLRF
jgi:hypothetical protein